MQKGYINFVKMRNGKWVFNVIAILIGLGIGWGITTVQKIKYNSEFHINSTKQKKQDSILTMKLESGFDKELSK